MFVDNKNGKLISFAAACFCKSSNITFIAYLFGFTGDAPHICEGILARRKICAV
jgi:hypothetical protein